VYHHLRDIEQPTLLISGALDPMTPAYQTREMKRKMPNARHVSFKLGTHFVLIEYPDETARIIEEFLAE
jgi:pimeloyl-ACP methyl ester carboxylesterase